MAIRSLEKAFGFVPTTVVYYLGPRLFPLLGTPLFIVSPKRLSLISPVATICTPFPTSKPESAQLAFSVEDG
jgi:hypothetical protein